MDATLYKIVLTFSTIYSNKYQFSIPYLPICYDKF
nr:MAG TPA: hypothetical protein [Caudoviricetes sp.]